MNLKLFNTNNIPLCNTHSFYDQAPFIIDKNVIILQQHFYNTELWFYNKLINEKFIVKIKNEKKRCDIWWKIYELYISSFFAENYCNVIQDKYKIIYIDTVQKQHIKTKNMHSNEMINLYNKIDDALIDFDTKCFIKTTGFTPKKTCNIEYFDK